MGRMLKSLQNNNPCIFDQKMGNPLQVYYQPFEN